MGFSSELFIDMQNELMDRVQQAENGDINHIDALIEFRAYKKYMEESINLLKEYENDHFNEIEQAVKEYPEGYRGYEFEVRNGRQIWDFKHIPEWQTHDNAKKECEQRYKNAFKARQNNLLVATEEGEEVILPKMDYAKGSIILKVKKTS